MSAPPLFALGSHVLSGELTPTVNARDLHAYLENGDDFSAWVADRIKQYGFVEGADYVTFRESSGKGRPKKEYAITIGMGKELSMVERNHKGKEARQYFLRCENIAKKELAKSISAEAMKSVARIEGKQTRRDLTDTIKDFVSYAKGQGSQSAEKYYMSITKMEYAALGMLEAKENGFRDTLNISQVHTLAVAEHIAREAILQGMEEGMFYKDIYKFAKQAVERYAATLPQNRRLAA